MITPKVGKVYRVEWLDHYDVPGTWINESEIDTNQVSEMVTFGLCVHSGAKYLTLAGTVSADKSQKLYSQVFRCLKSDIKSIKEIG